jgi:hypothetical protein
VQPEEHAEPGPVRQGLDREVALAEQLLAELRRLLNTDQVRP